MVSSVFKPDGTVAVENVVGKGDCLDDVLGPWQREPASPVSSINEMGFDPGDSNGGDGPPPSPKRTVVKKKQTSPKRHLPRTQRAQSKM